MKTVIRFDQGSLRKPERTSQGFLKVDGLAARCGIQEYRNKDGSIRRELRLPEDVFRADSLAAYEGISITDGHPTVLVDASNVRTLEAGTVTGVARRDGDWVVTPLVIKDPKLIAKVESGETGLSVGYKIRLDETPGVHPVYGQYDAIQRTIDPNHIAGAAKQPRAGDGAQIRMDDAMFAVEESTSDARTDSQIDRLDAVGDLGLTPENTMDKDEQIRLLKLELAKATETATKAVGDLQVRTDERDKLDAQLKVAKEEHGKLQVRLDAGIDASATEQVKEIQVRLDSALGENVKLKESVPALVRRRASLIAKSRAVMGDDYRADSIDDRAIMEAGILRLDPKADIKGQSDAHVEARFDALYDARVATATSLKRASAELAVTRLDSAKEDHDPFDPLNNGVGQYASPHARQKGA